MVSKAESTCPRCGGCLSKGRTAVRETLEVAGGVLTVGSSALGIALAIKELKG